MTADEPDVRPHPHESQRDEHRRSPRRECCQATVTRGDLAGAPQVGSPACAGPDELTLGPEDEPWVAFDGPCGVDDDPPIELRMLENGGDALDVLLRLVGAERSGPAALWFLVLDAHDRVLPSVLPISDVPTVPDRVVADNLVHVLSSVLDNDAIGGSVVIAYVRRGGGDRGAFENAWSTVLRDRAATERVRVRAEVAIGRDRARVLSPGW